MSTVADAVVIGGGPAGSAFAILLARAGRHVVLLEREPGPHDKVCGEFLSGEAASYLEALGVNLAAEGALPIAAVRLAVGRKAVTVPLPFPARSLSRRRLDAALLDLAAGAGADIRRGAWAARLEQDAGVWRAVLKSGEQVAARSAIVATGKHDLRGLPRRQGVQSDLVAFKQHWQLSGAETAGLRGLVELAPFSGGYAGLEGVETGRVNLCLVVKRSRLDAVGGWDGLLAAIRAEVPALDARLTGAAAVGARPLAAAAIPYGHVCRTSDGLWRLGDQAAVIPSFSGDGIAIALHSACRAAEFWLDARPAADYQRVLAVELGTQVRLATFLSLALVRPFWQAAMRAGIACRPDLLTRVARMTRIPDPAVRSADRFLGEAAPRI